jgi:transcriptional regulator with XRE-family HTH domain
MAAASTHRKNQVTRAALTLRSAGTLAAIAARIGVSVRAVSSWRAGAKLPSSAHQGALLAAYGIAPRDWYLAPEGAPTVNVAPAPPASLQTQLSRANEALDHPDLEPGARLEIERLRAAIEIAIIDAARAARRPKTTGTSNIARA